MLIKKSESVGLKKFIISKVFTEYLNDMYEIYESIVEYNLVLAVYDDVTTDMLSNKKRYLVLTDLFIRVKISTFLLFLLQNLIFWHQNIRLSSTHYFITNIPNKRNLQQMAFNHSLDIGYEDFTNLYKNVLKNHILY